MRLGFHWPKTGMLHHLRWKWNAKPKEGLSDGLLGRSAVVPVWKTKGKTSSNWNAQSGFYFIHSKVYCVLIVYVYRKYNWNLWLFENKCCKVTANNVTKAPSTRLRFHFTENAMKVLRLHDRFHIVLPVHTETMETTENAFNLLLALSNNS